MWIVPESPHYLAARGDAAGAAETLRRVSRANGRDGRLPRGVLKMPAAETPGGMSSGMSVAEDAVSGNAEDKSARGLRSRRARELKKTMAGLAKPFATVRATLSAKNRTLTLMLWFIFFGYIMVRNSTEDPEKGKRFAAVVAIIGAMDIPFIHLSVVWFRSLHPEPVVAKPDGPTLPGDMLATLLFGVLVFSLLFFGFFLFRYAVEALRAEADLRARSAT